MLISKNGKCIGSGDELEIIIDTFAAMASIVRAVDKGKISKEALHEAFEFDQKTVTEFCKLFL